MLNVFPSPPQSPPPLAPVARPHRRGAQPGNHNARKNGTFSRLDPGPLAPIRLQIRSLNAALRNPALPPQQVHKQVQTARKVLGRTPLPSLTDEVHAIQLELKLIRLNSSVLAPLRLAASLSNVLQDLAQSPLTWFEEAYRDSGITRDADSFFPVSIKSAFNSSADYSTHRLLDDQTPHLPNYSTRRLSDYKTPRLPNYQTPRLSDYSTNLTASQWSVLAPLIPPDPHLDWLTGEPPVIIAANRWGFSKYSYTGDFQDFVILQEYQETLQRIPSLSVARVTGEHDTAARDTGSRETGTRSPTHDTAARDTGTRPPGRPRTPPRLLLDAIIWKMATGHTWSELPAGFPPPPLCSRYYRRLYRSGRWFTLVLALYNHFRMQSSTDLVTLMKKGTFTTAFNGKLALHPRIKLTWENCTALLFMQLARAAWSIKQRVRKQAQPFYPIYPIFKGTYPLTTGLPPGISLPPPAVKPSSRPSPASKPPSEPFPDIQSLEDSLAWKKWQKLEKGRQIIQDGLASLLNTGPPGSI